MNTNPENPVGWTLPAEFPNAFALPQEFRQSLPAGVQKWLNDIEKRIDGLTLNRIKEEANEEAVDSYLAETLYLLGRRFFYARMQQIVDIMFPEHDVEVGIDLLWVQTVNSLPGSAVCNALNDNDGAALNSLTKEELKEAGV